MKLLRTIRDTDVGLNIPDPQSYEERRAARAVVFNEDKKVALLHVAKMDYHKLPGGGIEEGEEIGAALRRELLEEVGCNVSNIRELGIVEEYRNDLKLYQVSYCFVADLSGDAGEASLEEDELAAGFESVWMSLEDAIKTIENETDIEDYEGKFIRLRDLAFLKEAEKIHR